MDGGVVEEVQGAGVELRAREERAEGGDGGGVAGQGGRELCQGGGVQLGEAVAVEALEAEGGRLFGAEEERPGALYWVEVGGGAGGGSGVRAEGGGWMCMG